MKEKIKKFLSIILLIVFIVSIIYIVTYLYTSYKDENNIKELQSIMNFVRVHRNSTETDLDVNTDEINQDENINKIAYEDFESSENDFAVLNFKEVQKINSDIVAWLKIDGTVINYPVLQGEDNDYYLYKNYKKDYSRYGSVFVDYRYDFEKGNQNFLVYGHNNNDDMMFNDLLKYNGKEFLDEHSKINLITSKENSTYKIISVFKSKVYGKDETNVFKYYNYIDLSNEETFEEFSQNIKNKSLYNIEYELEYGDELLTLSTCEYSVPNGRFVVVAVKEK